MFGETNSQRTDWVAQRTLQMLSSHTQQLIDEFRQLAQERKHTTASQRRQLTKVANYFERNMSYMDYATYLAHGWPIASGVIEGACRHFVKDRLELSGMRWTLDGAENLLRLRAVSENGDWEAYHDFRKQQRHIRLYGTTWPPAAHPEELAVEPSLLTYTRDNNPAASPDIIICEALPEHQIRPDIAQHYHSLPLVV